MVHRFGEFELDGERCQLRRAGHVLAVQPRVLDLLLYLVDARGRVVSRDELLAQIWSGVHVAESSLYRAVAIARRLLGDGAGTPEPIELVRGRGYRFAAPLAAGAQVAPEGVVGREAPLAALSEALERARSGQRQLVLVSGEAGIGKSALVEAFARQAADAGARVAVGRCLGGLGDPEALSPMLEALAQLARGASDAAVVETLQRVAPGWLLQLSDLVTEDAWESLEARTLGLTRERLVEELANALGALSAQRPLVLVLEDLHWADASTLATLAALAQRGERARLLLVASARSGEPRSDDTALRSLIAELKTRDLCQELELGPLDEREVAELVRLRAGVPAADPEALARRIAERSGGNPLFALALLEHLHEAGADVPEGVRALIESQVAALDAESVRVLETASAAGVEFSVLEVAAGADLEPARVEEVCDALARRRRFLRRAGVDEWPDGSTAERYAFVHALHRELLYERLRAARRASTHRAIALRIESGWQAQAARVAGAIAQHFERGREPARAVAHYAAAIEDAARRLAAEQGRAWAERALRLVPALPAEERDSAELRVRFALWSALAAPRTERDAELEELLLRCETLCELTGDHERLLAVLWGRSHCRFWAGDGEGAMALSRRLLEAAEASARTDYTILAHDSLAASLHKLSRCAESERHAERVLELYDPAKHGRLADRIGLDVATSSAIASAHNNWHLGRPERACARMNDAIARARATGHAFSLVLALCYGAGFHLSRSDRAAAGACAEEAARLAAEQRFPGHAAFAGLMRAAAIADPKPRLDAMLAALARFPPEGDSAEHAAGAAGVTALFAEVLAELGARDPALEQIERAFALAKSCGERHVEPALYRLRASLMSDPAARALELEASLRCARELGSRVSELFAALDLARLQRGTPCEGAAIACLRSALAPFAQDCELRELREARELAA